MTVQWYTAPGDILGNGTSTVEYGLAPRSLDTTVQGYNWTYTDTSSQRNYSFHLATMTGLVPGTTYFYRVGDDLDGWSSVFSFVATRAAASFTPEAPLRIGVVGDMGWTNAQALPYLQSDTARGSFDLVIHVGDLA